MFIAATPDFIYLFRLGGIRGHAFYPTHVDIKEVRSFIGTMFHITLNPYFLHEFPE